MPDLAGLRALYAATASHYETDLAPAFGPLADDLATWLITCVRAHRAGMLFDPFDLDPADYRRCRAPAPPGQPLSTALDLGTGTGLLARAIAPHAQAVIGLDLSPHMLARAARAPNLHYVCADLHAPPIGPGKVGLVASSFGLNASAPRQSLRTIARLLRPNGILAFQEWGPLDRASQIVEETVCDHEPQNTPMDPAIREFYESPKPWYDELQDREDYYLSLKRSGFAMVWVKEAPFVSVGFESVEGFTRCKLAWPLYRAAVDGMTPDGRVAFQSDLRERLRPYTRPDGRFDWTPPLFRVFAVRSGP